MRLISPKCNEMLTRIIKDQNYCRAAMITALFICILILNPLQESYNLFWYRVLYTLTPPLSSIKSIAITKITPSISVNHLSFIKIASIAQLAGADEVIICSNNAANSSPNFDQQLYEKIINGTEFSYDSLLALSNHTNKNTLQTGATSKIHQPRLLSNRFTLSQNKINKEKISSIIPIFNKPYQLPLMVKYKDTFLPHISLSLYTAKTANSGINTQMIAYPFYYDTAFTKNPLLHIPFEALANYTELILERSDQLTLLAYYTNNTAYKDISDALSILLNKVLSRPGDPQLLSMFRSAEKDAMDLGEKIINDVTLINDTSLPDHEQQGIQETIKRIEKINQLLNPLSDLAGKTLFIDDQTTTGYTHIQSPRFFGSYYSPAEESAYLLLSLINNNTGYPAQLWILLISLILLAVILYAIYYRYPLAKAQRITLYLIIPLFIVHLSIFQICELYINAGSLHLLYFLTFITMQIEHRLRIYYFSSLRKRFGLNISPITIEKIAVSSKKISLEQNKPAAVLYIHIVNIADAAAHIPPNEFTKALNEFSDTFRSLSEEREGVILSMERGVFTCAFGITLSENAPVNDAILTALSFKASIAKMNNQKIIKKNEFAFEFRGSIDYAPVSPYTTPHGDYNLLTVYGSILNITRRMIKISKEYNADIILTENALNYIETEYTYRSLDKVKFSKQNLTTTIYEIIGTKELLAPLSDFLLLYQEGQTLFYQKKFKEARQFFRKASRLRAADGPSLYFIKRCNHYLKSDEKLKRTIEI